MKATGQTAGQTRDAGGTLGPSALSAIRTENRLIMDGSPVVVERTIPTVIVPGAVVDIEVAIQWAVAQSRYLPWLGVHDRELMLDGGYTVIPKGCDRRYHSRGLQLAAAVNADAAVILAALEQLDPWTRSIVTANAKRCRRPDWMEGVEPKQVEQRTYMPVGGRKNGWRKKGRKKQHRAVVVTAWESGISPDTIRVCREVYACWHAALSRLATTLDGMVSGFKIKGLKANAQPWGEAIKESA